MKKNQEPQRSVFFVEKNERYWWFFDLYGSTLKIRAYCGVAERPSSCKYFNTWKLSRGAWNGYFCNRFLFLFTAMRDLHSQRLSDVPNYRSDPGLDCISFRNEPVPALTSPQTVLLVLNYNVTGSRSSFEPISIHIPTSGGSTITASTSSLTSASSEDYLSPSGHRVNEQMIQVPFATCSNETLEEFYDRNV